MNTLKFYIKPFVLLILLNAVFYYLFGAFLEAYEGLLSSIVQCTYSEPNTKWWTINIHFLIAHVYETLVNYIYTYNVYGTFLLFYNLLSLTFLGLVLYRIFAINLRYKRLPIFILLYTILCIDNFININSTRQSFILTIAALGFIESHYFEGKVISKKKWILLFLIFLFASLIRFEAVLLFSAIYFMVQVIYKRIPTYVFLPIIISGFFFFLFSFLIKNYASESKKILTYKEKEIVVRDNIDYQHLTKNQLLEVQALKDYFIADEIHFKFNFYDEIRKYPAVNNSFSILDRVSIDYFQKTIKISFPVFLSSWPYFLFFIVTSLLFLIRNRIHNVRFVIYFIFIIFGPILLCFHSVIAFRFLTPFLVFASCWNVLMYIYYYKIDYRILSCCIVFNLLFLFNTYVTKKVYLEENNKFITLSNKLHFVAEMQPEYKPVIIYINFPNNYFPVNPLREIKKQNAIFFNFYLFSGDEHHAKAWEKNCHCNPLSLKDKIDYMVKNQNLFLIDEKTFLFLKDYMFSIYHIKIEKKNIGNFDKEVLICKVYYI